MSAVQGPGRVAGPGPKTSQPLDTHLTLRKRPLEADRSWLYSMYSVPACSWYSLTGLPVESYWKRTWFRTAPSPLEELPQGGVG